MVAESPRIPPIEPQMTTIATNITQTPQTPLDQKVDLKRQEKALVQQPKKKEKDQVAINEQQQVALKERRKMKALSELQIVVLFCQLMAQGLLLLEENAESLQYLLTIDELEKSSVRQELPVLFNQLRSLLQNNLQQIEQQQQDLFERLPYAIQQTSQTWQIKKGENLFPFQRRLLVMETKLDEVTFPDTQTEEAHLIELNKQQMKLQTQRQQQEYQRQASESHLRNLEKQLALLMKQQTSEGQIMMKSTERLREKKQELASIQAFLEQMQRIHPLKRKQYEYQSYLLRGKLLEQERKQLELEQTNSQERSQALEATRSATREAIDEIEQRLAEQLTASFVIKEQSLRQQQQIESLTVAYKKRYQTAYENLTLFFERQLRQLSNERQINQAIETQYRSDLTERLQRLKKNLKQQSPENKKRIETLQSQFTQAQSAVFLSQANAEASHVEQILSKKEAKKT